MPVYGVDATLEFDFSPAANARPAPPDEATVSHAAEIPAGKKSESFPKPPDAAPSGAPGAPVWPAFEPSCGPQTREVAAFEVQVSDNLADWVPANPADIDTTTDSAKVTYTLPPGAAKKFCRLVVTA